MGPSRNCLLLLVMLAAPIGAPIWATGCGYLDDEILLDDETFGEGLALEGMSWSGGSGCGGFGHSHRHGYGYGHASIYGSGYGTYDFGEMNIVGAVPNAGAPLAMGSPALGVDQEEQFEKDAAPLGAIEAVIVSTVQGREAAVVQFAQARSSRDAR